MPCVSKVGNEGSAGFMCSQGDLEIVSAAGKGSVDVTVGSALDIFGGTLAYKNVLDWHRGSSC